MTGVEWLTLMALLVAGGIGLWLAREQASLRTRKKLPGESLQQ